MEHFLPGILYAVLILAVFFFFLSLFLLRRQKHTAEELNRKEQDLKVLQKQFDTLLARNRELTEFRKSLHEAELTTRLQIPRLNQNSVTEKQIFSHTERYRFIHLLSEKGMNNTDIAEILSVSTMEVDQVLALTALCK